MCGSQNLSSLGLIITDNVVQVVYFSSIYFMNGWINK